MKREGTLPATCEIQAGRREQQQRAAFHNFQSECATSLFSAFKTAGVADPRQQPRLHGTSSPRCTKEDRSCLGRLFPLLAVPRLHPVFTSALLVGSLAR